MSVSQPSFKVGLTQEEKKLYSQLFKSLDPEGSGIVTGEKARATFEKTGLPPNILGEIWQLADHNNVGFLTQFGFCYAMRLIGVPGPSYLAPQSTSSSFLQTQPSSLIPQNTATQQLQPSDPIGPVSTEDYERFKQMFVKTTGSESVPLNGNAAKDILMKAKLPTATLGQIWALVDVHNKGSLDLHAFVIAMHLIHGLLSGSIKNLPPFLPETVWQSVDVAKSAENQGTRQVSQASVSSQSSTVRHPPASSGNEWAVSPQQKQMFDAMFDNLDTQRTGKLSPDQVANFLMTSRLGQQDLATIWDLADIQNTGIFTKLEFSIALFLVNRKRSGLALPNVVPQTLIQSLSGGTQQVSQSQPQQQTQAHQAAAAPYAEKAPAAQTSKAKSSLDELADVFGSQSPPPQTAKPALEQRASSSDLTGTELPKSLLSQQQPKSSPVHEPPNLIGDDVPKSSASPVPAKEVTSSQAQQASPVKPQEQQKTVDYEALRSVPPPPKRNRICWSDQTAARSTTQQTAPQNNDLLADSEVSGQLSQANTDIANISNQIKSLTSQTSNLHEKKTRADQELTRILAVKQEIDNKLKTLRASYANEVKQVEQVEATLRTAREETEALRSEASIAEAKLNNVSGELHEKQVAVEELQKTNNSLREKLGNLNAEIAEVEKTLKSKQAENTKLSNDVNVKKSQVQVSIVKIDEIKSKIAELEDNTRHLHEEHASLEKQEVQNEQQARELQSKHADIQERSQQQSSKSKLGLGAAATAAAGAALGAGVAGAHFVGSSDEDNKDAETKEVQSPSPAQNTVDTEKSPAQVIPGSLESQLNVNEETEDAVQQTEKMPGHEEPFVNAIVDEVQEKPTEDMTGVDDFSEASHHGQAQKGSKSADAKFSDDDDIKNRFPEVPYDNGTNHTTTSSVATDYYRRTEYSERSETPVTSPNSSDYQFQSSGSGIPGSMVGMPNVLVGVQRTDSLTSSIQNNPSMSVRDDNIGDVSERETLSGDIPVSPAPSNQIPRAQKEQEGQESSEGERISSGVESFEMVNADEARALESHSAPQQASHPLAQSFVQPSGSQGDTTQSQGQDEEFPPIRELEIDESSSDEEPEDEFDDAVDNLNSQGGTTQAPRDEFDDFEDDLRPATQEGGQATDAFDDEFDGLKTAQADKEEDFDVGEGEFSIDDHFTGVDDAVVSTHPDFTGAGQNKPESNDEWEQLFAGFGNAAAPSQSAPVAAPDVTSPDASKHLAIQELVGMGFEKGVVIDALEKENWNVEAATNYLLDHA
ncbi:hypothetical protein CJJ09_001911 [Candidozyma auris]|nr:hypothetical protein CJJ09_001911 [[Candida] auris]